MYVYNFIYIFIWQHWVLAAAFRLFSLLAARRGYSLVEVHGLLSCRGAQALGHMASVVAAPGLESTGSVAVMHWLSCFSACGIFLDQEWDPCFLHRQVDS